MKDMPSISHLKSLETRLCNSIDQVSIRGLADGPFLFACHRGRSVEVSTNDGQWWIEFWEKSDDEDAAPIGEVTVASEEEACQALLDWLTDEKGMHIGSSRAHGYLNNGQQC